MILLVAEKPSVANQHYKPMLERLEGEHFTQGDGCLIGKNHCITWCIGHLITLAPMDQYQGMEGPWKLSNLPLLPEKFRLMAIESTQKQLGIVQSMMAKADVLVNGADAGREGNLIFDLVLDFTPEFKKKTIKRLWVNSYVAKDLDKAWKNLEDATERINLSYAARLRQRADWMVGLNATRAYTLTAGRGKTISVGRVQTPTLNLVVERDTIVEQFKELFYYGVIGTWKGFQAQLLRPEKESEDKRKTKDTSASENSNQVIEGKQGLAESDSVSKPSTDLSNYKIAIFESEFEAQAIIDKCSPPKEAVIATINVQQKKQFPGKPFDLTELQKEGNKRFKYSAQQVLDCAQNLYEKKLLTYPRTDSQYLPDTMKQEAYTLAKKLATPAQNAQMRAQSESFVFINSSKVTDHFAIIPTGEMPSGLPEMEQKIYDLVLERFVTAWLKPYVWSEMEVTLQSPASAENHTELTQINREYNFSNPQSETTSIIPDKAGNDAEFFRLKLKRNEDLGFKSLQKEEKKTKSKKKGDEESDNSDDITNIVEVFPEWVTGDQAPFDTLEFQKKKKSKPKYFTEATLLAAMKTAGRQIENEELAEAMKERGLGTPATQAGIIETLKKRGFIESQKNYLVSTQRGREVIALMDARVKSPEMTGEWEYKLSQVEKGLLEPVQFRDGIVEYVRELFAHLHEKYGSQFERETVTEQIVCPKCNTPLEIAPWGYVCKNGSCGFKAGHTIAGRTLSHAEMKQLLETGKSELFEGFISKKGTMFSATLALQKDFNISFEFSDKTHVRTPTEFICPKCGKQIFDSGNRLVCEEPCDFVFFKTMASRILTAEEIAELFKNGSTAVLTGFKNKKGQEFSAKIVWNENRNASFAFESDGKFHGSETKYKCPLCRHTLEENKNAIFCTGSTSTGDCKFTLFKTVAGKKLRAADIKALLAREKTELISGFKSKSGNSFDAFLKMDANGKIGFEFLQRNFTCPICADMMQFRSSTDSSGKSIAEYACNRCGFRIPQVFYQRKFTDEEVENLLKNKTTPVLEKFKKNDTVFRAALEIRDGKLTFNKLTVEKI